MTGLERRYFPLQKLEMRAASENSPGKIYGYAAVFNSLSVEMWGFYEMIMPGAFTETIAGDDIRALWNHNTDFPLGRTTNGTLALQEDETGLAFDVEPPDTQLARDFTASIRRGDVDQASLMFRAIKTDWKIDDQERVIRCLYKAKLYEVSPVTFPAYTATSVGLRGALLPQDEKIEIPADILRRVNRAAQRATQRDRFLRTLA